MKDINKTGFDRLREQIGSEEQNEYVLIALAIEAYHKLEASANQSYFTEWFDNSWTNREVTARMLASDLHALKRSIESEKE